MHSYTLTPVADEEHTSPGELTDVDAATRAAVLVEALPYIQAFADKVVVVKFGGNAVVDPALSKSFAADIVLLRAIGLKRYALPGGHDAVSEAPALRAA